MCVPFLGIRRSASLFLFATPILNWRSFGPFPQLALGLQYQRMKDEGDSMSQSEIKHAHELEMQRVLHDLSNTLTGLLMNAGLLSLALRSNERLRRYADDIHESATASADLLRRVRIMFDGGSMTIGTACDVTDERDVQHKMEHEDPRFKRSTSSTRTQ
jgi:hypothetical protein